MPRISELFVYPVKSCAAIGMSEVSIVPTGFEYDRNWMIVDGDGAFVTQREQPSLALVAPQIGESGLRLQAPGMAPLDLPADDGGGPVMVTLFGESHRAIATNAAADAWVSRYLDGPFRLVRCDPRTLRLGGVQYPERDAAPTSFVDNYGVLVISQASHTALNRKLPEAVPMNRFRPNIVLSGVEDHDEDYITHARCGEVALRFINPCFRCNLTSIDQQIGRPGFDPLPVLATYRYDEAAKGVKFGAYAAISQGIGGRLHVGCDIEVDWSF
jgi:uncharacterized protein